MIVNIWLFFEIFILRLWLGFFVILGVMNCRLELFGLRVYVIMVFVFFIVIVFVVGLFFELYIVYFIEDDDVFIDIVKLIIGVDIFGFFILG